MTPEEVRTVTAAGAFAELSFFFITHATQIGLTHVDAQKNSTPAVTLAHMDGLIRAATPAATILSSDCGVYVLPPPVEGLREFALMIASLGLDPDAMRLMLDENPGQLFRVGSNRSRPVRA